MFHTSTPNPGGQRIWLQFVFRFHGLFASPGPGSRCTLSSSGGCFSFFLLCSSFETTPFRLLSWILFLWSNYRLTSNLKNPNSRLWGRTMWSWSKTSSKSWARSLTAARLLTSSYAYWRSLTSRSAYCDSQACGLSVSWLVNVTLSINAAFWAYTHCKLGLSRPPADRVALQWP